MATGRRTVKSSKHSPKRVEIAERKKQALELRKAGATYRQIGDQLNVSQQMAYNYVKSAMDELIREPAEELRTMQYERLNTILLTIWPQVREGVLPAIDRALRIMERQATLLGLDAPLEINKTETRVSVSVDTGDYISQLQEVRRMEVAEKLGEGDGGMDSEIVLDPEDYEEDDGAA